MTLLAGSIINRAGSCETYPEAPVARAYQILAGGHATGGVFRVFELHERIAEAKVFVVGLAWHVDVYDLAVFGEELTHVFPIG
jgi:hypothetical protein